jgi:hypothetical protein
VTKAASPSPLQVDTPELEADQLGVGLLQALQNGGRLIAVAGRLLKGGPPSMDINLKKTEKG